MTRPTLIALLTCALAVGTFLTLAVPQTEGRSLAIGNAGEPQTLDPHKYNLRLEETLLNDLFLGLTTFNAEGQQVPGAATSWETSADGLTWTFTLRDDLAWSDGTPLTAHDFVYSFRRLLDPATAASLAYFMYMLEGAEAVNTGQSPPQTLGVSAPGPTTLVVKLEKPYPYFLERLLYPTAFPVPRHAIEAFGDDWVKPEHWVSNGAYRLKDWRPQGYVHLEANPHFIDTVAIDEVRYHPTATEQNAYNRFRNGELDAIGLFPIGELETARREYPDALRMSGLLSMFYMVFNTQRAPLDDVRVRKALTYAIDQPTLTDKVLRSGNEASFSFAPNLIDSYEPVPFAHHAIPHAERLEQARELLAQAGYDASNPLEIVLRHVSGLENKKVNLAITGMWKAIGVKAVLHQSEVRTHFADLRAGDFDVAWAGWVGENNAEHYLSLLQSTIGNVNYGRFADAQFDALMATAQSEADLQSRNEKLRQAERLATEHYAVAPLYTSAVRRLVNPELKGWFENARDVHQVRYLSW